MRIKSLRSGNVAGAFFIRTSSCTGGSCESSLSLPRWGVAASLEIAWCDMNKAVPGKNAGAPELTWANAPDILTVEEAAFLARIPRNAAYEAVRQGVIP